MSLDSLNFNSSIRACQCAKYKIWFAVLETNYVGESAKKTITWDSVKVFIIFFFKWFVIEYGFILDDQKQ